MHHLFYKFICLSVSSDLSAYRQSKLANEHGRSSASIVKYNISVLMLRFLIFFITQVRNCLVVMCHNARRTVALRKSSAIIPLVIVGVLIHGAGRSKEQKSEEDQAALKVQSCDKRNSDMVT